MAKSKTISVCNNCEKPVVWTFAFDGAEYYCLLCAGSTGMFGGKKEVKSTSELVAWKMIIERVWKALRQNHTGSGRYRVSKCLKCKEEDHGRHFSKSEIERDKVVRWFLEVLSVNK